MYVKYKNGEHDLVLDMNQDVEQNTYKLILKTLYCVTLLGIFLYNM